MKIEKLIENEVYFILWGPSNVEYIVKRRNKTRDISLELKTNKYHYSGDFNYPNYWNEIRLATAKEKAWLEQCERLGKFIPLDQIEYSEIVNNYELY